MDRYEILPESLKYDSARKAQIERDYLRFCNDGLPKEIEGYIEQQYGVDVSSRYGGLPIKIPFGLASGQLSTGFAQVKNAIQSGIGFVVMKTVLSQDQFGNSTMQAWKVDAPHMKVEKIASRSGREGYTVTWKGRGWHKSFGEYLRFMRQSLSLSKDTGVPVIPSCKFNLPADEKNGFQDDEYRYTLARLAEVWRESYTGDMYLEKDFSPTLAGSDLAEQKDTILWWIRQVPGEIKKMMPEGLTLGLKLLNTLFEDQFQLELLQEAMGKNNQTDYLVCFNRLFDPEKVFEGKKGVAFGGYDLSERNLKILSALRLKQQKGLVEMRDIPISATGNICTGRMMAEYALRGCQNGQIHTGFQLPDACYGMKTGTRMERALNELFFNPCDGLLASVFCLHEMGLLDADNAELHFSDVVGAYKRYSIFKDWEDVLS